MINKKISSSHTSVHELRLPTEKAFFIERNDSENILQIKL